MDAAWDTLHRMGHDFVARLPYVGVGILVAIVFHIVGRIIRRVVHTAGVRTRLDVQLADLFGALAVGGLTVFGILVACVIIFPGFNPGELVAGIGFGSVVLGFAFKDILQNYFAGILLLLRKPFAIGDQILTVEHEGTVEGINVRSTYLTTYNGERVVIPNSEVWTHTILVRTSHPKRRVQFDVQVANEEQLEEARRAIFDTVSATEGVMPDPGPWVYVQDLAPQWVLFRVYFWASPTQDNVLKVRDAAMSRVKLVLDERGIEMPYPREIVRLEGLDQVGRGDSASAAT